MFVPGFVLLGAVLFAQASSPSSFVVPAEVPQGFAYYHDVLAGKGGDRDIKIEIVAPKSDPGKKLPVVVYIHGGGWNKGNKDEHAKKISGFAARGYVGVALSYRLSSDGYVFPAQVEDVKLGIRYLRANASRYFLDADKMGVLGTSSGAHLAAFLGTSADVPRFEGDGGWKDVSSAVSCVVDFSGPVDFTTDFADAWGSLTMFLKGKAKRVPDIAKDAMPATWASPNDPPILILHGNMDTTVPFTDSVDFAQKLRAAGVDTTFGLVGGAGHSFSDFPWTNDLAWRFFDYHLKGVGERPADPPLPPLPETVASASVKDGNVPLAAWSFDELDSRSQFAASGRLTPGVPLKLNNGGSLEVAQGKRGGALHLKDGFAFVSNAVSNKNLEVQALNFGSSMGIELLLKLDELPSAYAKDSPAVVLVSKISTLTKTGYELIIDPSDNRLAFRLYETPHRYLEVKEPAASLGKNTWYHVAASFDEEALKLYVDGAERASFAWKGRAYALGTYDLKIGSTNTVTLFPCTGVKGWIDELKLYNAAPTAEFIRAQAAAQLR